MTYKELAKIISELPEERQNEDASLAWDGEVYEITDIMSADQLDEEDKRDDIITSLHEDHFVLLSSAHFSS